MNDKQIERLKAKYPDRIPIVVVKYEGKKEDTKNTELTRNKFLVPKDMNAAAFLQILRKYITVSKQESLIFFVDNVFLLPMQLTMAQIMKEYQTKNPKNTEFLRLTYNKENVFGYNSR
jgi:hypothetical protein